MYHSHRTRERELSSSQESILFTVKADLYPRLLVNTRSIASPTSVMARPVSQPSPMLSLAAVRT